LTKRLGNENKEMQKKVLNYW